MRSTRQYLWFVVFVVMLFVLVSGGCGGGSSGSSEESRGYAWDTDPPQYDLNQPDNDTGDDDTGYDDTGDTTPNPQPDNTGNSSPVAINGTWEIVSGHGITSTDNSSGGISVTHVTYSPGKNGKVGINMSKSDDYFGGSLGYFSTTLTGDNVAAGGLKGNGILTVFCTVTAEEHPSINADATMIIPGGFAYEYIGNRTYRMTDENYDKAVGVKANAGDYENTMTLENASTLRWTYQYKAPNIVVGSFMEYRYEIVLRKVQ